ncbi:Uncharacterised protein [Mycobacterium tuberculosis]|nr:Uncharacterised protein [Mycobacterium tuberculosis]
MDRIEIGRGRHRTFLVALSKCTPPGRPSRSSTMAPLADEAPM